MMQPVQFSSLGVKMGVDMSIIEGGDRDLIVSKMAVFYFVRYVGGRCAPPSINVLDMNNK